MEMRFYIKVLSKVVLLEGVPTKVMRVSKKCDLVPVVFYACILPQPYVYLLNDKSMYYLNTLKHVSNLKKQ